MAVGEIIAVIMLVVLLGLSFFCSLAETALFTLNAPMIAGLKERGSKRDHVILDLLDRSKDTLAGLTFLNTVANFSVASLSLCMMMKWQYDFNWVLLSLLLLIVVCEICSKTLAMRHPDVWAPRVTPLLKVLLFIIKPFRFSFLGKAKKEVDEENHVVPEQGELPSSRLSMDEYRELLELACQQGAMNVHEKNFIAEIISLDTQTAHDTMKLRSQVAYVLSDASKEEMITAAKKYKHRRLPMFDKETNTVVGILNTRKLLLYPEQDLDEAIDVPVRVPDSMNLLLLLKRFQSLPTNPGMVVVLDEFGEAVGIITMEDILEEVVGNIRSESEELGLEMEKIDDDNWRVNGSFLLEELTHECPEIKAPEHIQTVSGLILDILETVPGEGQSIMYCGYRFTVLSVDFARIREVKLTRLSPKTKTRSLLKASIQ